MYLKSDTDSRLYNEVKINEINNTSSNEAEFIKNCINTKIKIYEYLHDDTNQDNNYLYVNIKMSKYMKSILNTTNKLKYIKKSNIIIRNT